MIQTVRGWGFGADLLRLAVSECQLLINLAQSWGTWDESDVEKSRWMWNLVGNSQRFFSFFRLTKEYNISDIMKAF